MWYAGRPHQPARIGGRFRCRHSHALPHRACHAHTHERLHPPPGPPFSRGRAFLAASALPAFPWPCPVVHNAFPYGAWTRRFAPAGFWPETSSSQTSRYLLRRRCRQNPPAPLLLLSPQSLPTLRGTPFPGTSGHFVPRLPYSSFRSWAISSGRVVSRSYHILPVRR